MERTMDAFDIHLRIFNGASCVVEFMGFWRQQMIRDIFKRLEIPFAACEMGMVKDWRFSVEEYGPEVPVRSRTFLNLTTTFDDVFDRSVKCATLYVYKQNRVLDPVLVEEPALEHEPEYFDEPAPRRKIWVSLYFDEPEDVNKPA